MVLLKRCVAVSVQYRRSFGTIVPLFNKTSDPIQKLFLEKIKEYESKSRNGNMVDSTPDIEREMKNELERVAKQFGGGAGVDMSQFPGFKFEDPKVDTINN